MTKQPEATRLELEWIAHVMDSAFRVPGSRIRFGADSVIGLIPGVGDLVSSLVTVYILGLARRHGVPRITLVRMASNVGIDFLIGSIPVAGDVFDVFWKANERNVALLRKHAVATTRSELRRLTLVDALFVAGLAAVLIAILVGAVFATMWVFATVWQAFSQARPATV
jgi:hypothetical protein